MRGSCGVLLALVLSTVACAAPPTAIETTSDADALRALIITYQDALNAGDADAAVAMFAPDAVLMPVGAPAQKGIDEIRAYYADVVLAAATFDSEFRPVTVEVDGNTAWATSAITIRATPTDGGESVQYESKGLFTFHRAAEAGWQVKRYMFNRSEAP